MNHSASKPAVIDALLRSVMPVMSKSSVASAKSSTSSERPFVSEPESDEENDKNVTNGDEEVTIEEFAEGDDF